MNYHYNLRSMFDETVALNSDRVALRYDTVSHTYHELNHYANKLAAYIQKDGLPSSSVIAIASTKSFEDYALMIACLKIGVPYTHLDVENPKERIMNIFKTCRPKYVFSKYAHSRLEMCCKESASSFLIYDEIILEGADYCQDTVDGDTLAYIMYTSGSTGIPKGAAITHQNLIHFIAWAVLRFDISAADNFANLSPLYFDNSVFDFYTALFRGASLTPVSREMLGRPLDLIHYLDKHKCTIWFSVPSLLIYLMTMKVLKSDSLKKIRVFIFGGEGYPKTELRKLYDLYHERAALVNVYGPTECTCICSSHTMSDGDFADMSELPSLGLINQNFSYVILDEGKVAKKGELCLLGPNIGKGYYHDEERTLAAFALYSDERHYSKTMYRTGDLVREEAGKLFFRGRKDNQIKHMGYRIELEEIEVALNATSQVLQAAVVYVRSSRAYGKIVAYLVPEYEAIDHALLKSELAKRLPSYMIPDLFKTVGSFPKNANGKIDKNKLVQN